MICKYMHEIYKKYAAVCSKYAANMQYMHLRALSKSNMQLICNYMQKICSEYAEIFQKYARNMPEICSKYAINMQQTDH
jgi:hypothetical protein